MYTGKDSSDHREQALFEVVSNYIGDQMGIFSFFHSLASFLIVKRLGCLKADKVAQIKII